MHIINRLYEAEFDFPPSHVNPKVQYMVATLPRSGSTFFCIQCWRTGALGAPMEYPKIDLNLPLKSRIEGGDDIEFYWQTVLKLRTSPNGVFGYKMFMSDYMEMGRRYPSMLKHFVPDHVIYLTRKDLLSQAISYSKAIRSNVWFAGVPVKQKPIYDRKHIQECKDMLLSQQQFWEDVFALTSTSVLRVTYEELLGNRKETLEKVGDFVGVRFTREQEVDIPCIEPQGDGESLVWRGRFLGESEQFAQESF